MRERIESKHLVLVPMTAAAAYALADGAVDQLPAGLRCAAGWPLTDTIDLLLSLRTIGDEDSLPWLMVHGTEIVGDLGWKGGVSPDGDVEIGYGLAESTRGRGYATEAVRALVGWLAAQPGVRRIRAEVSGDNPASSRVLERVGFTRTPAEDYVDDSPGGDGPLHAYAVTVATVRGLVTDE